MKRTLLIVALALAFALAFGATPAFAKYAGFNSSMQYVEWATATAMGSANADSALMASGPHKGYATTTVKCAVCHSMHRAGNKLLSDGGGCAVCHTTTYYGGTALANTISWKVTAGAGPHSSCASTYCHGGPHGVGASSYAGPATRLLVRAADNKLGEDTLANGLAVATLGTWDANTRVLGTGAVCSQPNCHVDSAFGIVTGGSQLAAEGEWFSGLGTVTGHRVIAAVTTNWNDTGGYAMGALATKTGKIAWKPVTYCNSCHDLTDDNNGNEPAFPHAINDVVSTQQGKAAGTRSAVWLTAGPNSDTTPTAVSTYDDTTGGTTVQTAAGSSILDGICLKCHRSSVSGVGVDF